MLFSLEDPEHDKDLLCLVLSGRFEGGGLQGRLYNSTPGSVAKAFGSLSMKSMNLSLVWQCKALEPVEQA